MPGKYQNGKNICSKSSILTHWATIVCDYSVQFLLVILVYRGEHGHVAWLGHVEDQTNKYGHVTQVEWHTAGHGAGVRVPTHLYDSWKYYLKANHYNLGCSTEQDEFKLGGEGGGPGKVVESVVIPNIELIVKTPSKHDPDEVAHEERQHQQLFTVRNIDLVQLLVHIQILPPESNKWDVSIEINWPITDECWISLTNQIFTEI